jgi:hypothetical protein
MDPTFPYAGKVRIPPKQFQLRARIETATRDTVNAKQVEHWQSDTPNYTQYHPKLEKSGNQKISESFSIEKGYSEPNYRISNIVYNDMAPMNTRTDARDYKQSQPFVAGGPDLEYNPYFDRYDPVRDPRNAVRELRSAVYEDKGTARGDNESQKMLRRQYENRWVAEELIDDDVMDTYLRYEIATAGNSNISSKDGFFELSNRAPPQ